jgi:hypothetical protein
MKLKFPKKINIASDTFKVKYNKNIGGGSFTFDDYTITIGTYHLKRSPKTVFSTILHEVSEIAHVICNTRYDDNGTLQDFKFFMSHKEFQVHNEIVATAIQQFIK